MQALEEVWRIPDDSLLAKESFLLGKCSHKRVRTGQGEAIWSPRLKDGGVGLGGGTGAGQKHWEKFRLHNMKAENHMSFQDGDYHLKTTALSDLYFVPGGPLRSARPSCILCEWRPRSYVPGSL